MNDRELLRLEATPAYQNKMFKTAAEAIACPRGDVILVQAGASGLVHNRAFDPELLAYDGSYQNEQGHSPAFKAHVSQVLSLVARHFAAMSILEIGCGKGAFLDLMRAAGHDARGVDPAYEGQADYIIPKLFEPGLGVRGDAIVMRHVLEHIPDPAAFLARIRDANGGSGRVYIEVPCFEWILRNHAWFDIFYEHANYFRLSDFHRMFGQVLASGTLFGGQYIYVVAELDSLRDPAGPGLDAPPALHLPAAFFGSLDRCARAVRAGVPSVVWGAAAKGVMFAHHMQARGRELRLAIDINPAKQGHHLAGSGLPVLSPDDAFSALGGNVDVFVMNSNYLSEIRAMGGPDPNYIAVDQT
jgi:SAM-dependent methyltransferase